MHEMSLMSEIIQAVSADAQTRGIKRVERIDVIAGELSNVLPDALELAFFYFQKQGIHCIDESTTLRISTEPAIARCEECQLEFKPDYRIALCSKCMRTSCVLLSGETFKVESYEGSE
ncbi:hydrogenase maturation nickel metallochaperone HypA [Jeotgalibacillus haloalkalitolerans]|uniref:Hydrogenase maturation factor HypA n=1 Tax=Jeotgalibacillus haloalkalitolerans TaxID=3104292 RepID=A0ABU5KNA3_9BACL|nr:hydrogenase maturation nickel metallochaperone HypA [Jeotgalibacillus sp. HH7-29]MDZ5712737.1 hydrogenase maturation nickel metallochaperone HypA [Jeotgalibacillus sp. HH7-29]